MRRPADALDQHRPWVALTHLDRTRPRRGRRSLVSSMSSTPGTRAPLTLTGVPARAGQYWVERNQPATAEIARLLAAIRDRARFVPRREAPAAEWWLRHLPP